MIGNWDRRKLAISMQEESRFVTAAGMVPANTNGYHLVELLLDQQREGLGIVPAVLTAGKETDTGGVGDSLRRRKIVAHLPIARPFNPGVLDQTIV